MTKFNLYPSLISAPLLKLHETLEQLNPLVQGYHIDIMDGHFVPNLTWGPQFVAAFQQSTSLPLHIHCMVSNPEQIINWLSLRPVDLLIIHAEATQDLHAIIEQMREKDGQVGIALKPETRLKNIEPFITLIDHLLIMSVNPGFSGQTFINASYKKLTEAKQLIIDQEAHCSLGIDGGINISNIASVVSHGATEIAAAQALFSASDPVLGLHALINAIEH